MPERGKTGAGAEAAEGVHSTDGRDPHDKSGVEDANTGETEERSGSEPLHHRDAEHKSGYGGEKAQPKTSSDQR
jgi:hypothetical protein